MKPESHQYSATVGDQTITFETGKLAAQARHAALQPISTMPRDQGCHRLDQPWPIRPDDCHYQSSIHKFMS